MKRALLGLLVACTTLGLASVALAGENANAAISLHVTKPTTKAAQCGSFAYRTDQTNPFDVKGQPCPHGLGAFDVWVVVCNGSDSVGIAGAEYGIAYDGALGSGADVESWRSCSDLEFPSDDWPASGSGNLQTYADCQVTDLYPTLTKAAFAVLGVLHVTAYGQDKLEITPRPVTGYLKVADCQAIEDDLTSAAVSRKGAATFCSNRQGYNFCKYGVLAGGQTTWGNLKNLYHSN